MATGEFDLLLSDVHSLKQKRSLVRPVVAELRKRFDVSVAEVGDADLLRRLMIGVAAVSGEAGHAQDVVQACEEFVAARPEFEFLSARVRVFRPGEDFAG